MKLKKIYYLLFILGLFYSGCKNPQKNSNQTQSTELANLENLARKTSFTKKAEEKFIPLLENKSLLEHSALSAELSYVALVMYDSFKAEEGELEKDPKTKYTKIYQLQMLAWSSEIIFNIAIKKLNEKKDLNEWDKNTLNSESDALASEFLATQTRIKLQKVLNSKIKLSETAIKYETDSVLQEILDVLQNIKNNYNNQSKKLLTTILSESYIKINNDLNYHQNNYKDKLEYNSLEGQNKTVHTSSIIEVLNLTKIFIIRQINKIRDFKE